MVVGHHHFDAAPVGFGHAVDAGDAVVDGDDDVRFLFPCGQFDDLRRQAVAVFKAIGHDEIDACAHGAQAAQRHGAGGGAVAIVVGHNDHALIGGDGVGQEGGGGVDVQQASGRDHGRQLARQITRIGQAACRKQARQYRVDAALSQHFGFAVRAGADGDAGSYQVWSSRAFREGLRQNLCSDMRVQSVRKVVSR